MHDLRLVHEVKQQRKKQLHQDSSNNAPIDRVGGVICSDLKVPMTPKDRLGNRYLINFVDHKSDYCRIFLVRTKDAAAKQFEEFLVFLENRFDVKFMCCARTASVSMPMVVSFARKIASQGECQGAQSSFKCQC